MPTADIRILLIEDNPGDARLVRENLALAGAQTFRLDWAPDLAVGLAHLVENDTDAILLDLGLPDSSGLSTFKKVHTRAPQTPIILLTGLEDEALAVKSVQSGAQDYLGKSDINGRHLIRMIFCAIDRERAQESLRNSENQLSNAAIIAHLGPWEYDVEQDLFTFNDPFYAIFGTTAAVVGGYTMTSAEYAKRFVHPDDREIVGVEMRRALETDDPNFNRQLEHRMIKADGTFGYISVRFFIVKDSKGKTVKTYGVDQDITGRRRAEEMLRESEARYRELFENINSGVAVYEVIGDGQDFIFKEFNRAGERIDHEKRERLIGKSILEVRPGVAQFGLLEVLRKVWRTGEATYNPATKYQDGRLTRWYENYIYKLPSGEIVAVFENVTERKQAEEKLRYQSFLLDSANDAIVASDAEFRLTAWNAAAERLYGWKAEEVLGKSGLEITRTEWPAADAEEMRRMIVKQGYWRGEASQIRKDGSRIPVEVSSIIMRDANGQPAGFVSINRDITARKQTEETLRESEEKYRVLFEGNTQGILATDMETRRFVDANPSMCRMLGYSAAELLQLGLADIHPKDSLDQILSDMKAMEREGESRSSAIPCLRKDGTIFYADIGGASTIIHGRRCTVGFFSDVTGRKQAEDKLRYQASLLESVNDAIVASDEKVRLTAWNAAAERLYGWKAEEILGRNNREILRTEWAGSTAKKMQAAIEERGFWRGEVTQVRKDGSRIPIEMSSLVIRDANGRITGYASINHDITERKRAEEELVQIHEQLRALTAYWQNAIEAERTRIARQLHDEFGQSMTALKMDLTWLAKRLPKEDEKAERLHGMNTLIDDSITLMRRIATDLRPNLLDDLGLNATLEWQAQEFSKRSGITVKLNLPKDDFDLDPGLSTALFRIFQEVLTNVIRHAQATRVNASLELKGKGLILTVHDNGRGISENELKAPRSLGLLGLRERAAQWGGETIIGGVIGKGTTVTVRIPLPASTGNGGKR